MLEPAPRLCRLGGGALCQIEGAAWQPPCGFSPVEEIVGE